MPLKDELLPAALHGPAESVPHIGLGIVEVEVIDPGGNGGVYQFHPVLHRLVHKGLAAKADLAHPYAGAAQRSVVHKFALL